MVCRVCCGHTSMHPTPHAFNLTHMCAPTHSLIHAAWHPPPSLTHKHTQPHTHPHTTTRTQMKPQHRMFLPATRPCCPDAPGPTIRRTPPQKLPALTPQQRLRPHQCTPEQALLAPPPAAASPLSKATPLKKCAVRACVPLHAARRRCRQEACLPWEGLMLPSLRAPPCPARP